MFTILFFPLQVGQAEIGDKPYIYGNFSRNFDNVVITKLVVSKDSKRFAEHLHLGMLSSEVLS